MNIGADFAPALGEASLLSTPANLLATSFDMIIWNGHKFSIEHDAGLSQVDYYKNNEDN